MSTRDDLQVVNHALRELVRLQLTGELAADVAWRERRQMLESVEAAWDELVEDATPAPGDAPEAVGGTAASETLAPAVASDMTPRARVARLAQASSWRLPLWALLLVFALLTFLYVGSL